MSLEELRNNWDSIEESTIEKQFSNEQINAILKRKHRSYFFRTLVLEIPILSVFLYFIVLISFRFDELEVSYLEIFAIASIAILVLLIIIRSIKIINIYRNGYLNKPHSIVLKQLAKQKISIQRFYLMNIVLGFGLIVILIILSIKIYNEYDLVQNKYFWLIILPSSLLFITLINRWIKKYYVKAIKEAEDLLKGLEE